MDFFFTFNLSSEPSSAHTLSEPETRASIPINGQYVDPTSYDAGGSGFGPQGNGCVIA